MIYPIDEYIDFYDNDEELDEDIGEDEDYEI